MTDSVVSFLLENLTQLLIHESKLLGEVEDQVKLLKNELSLIYVFLQNSEGKRHDKLVKEVVSQIRDVAYEAEDVIDTFIMTETKHRKRNTLRKAFHYFDRASALHEVANEIERIKNVIKEIYENKNKYGIEKAESSGGDAKAEEILHRRRRDVEEDHVVGFDHDTQELVKQLIEGSSQLSVVSITGMGGLGKTTLTRKIYNNNDVKKYFDFRAWVYVSQEYKIKELLLEMLKGLTPLPKVMFRAELKEELLRSLEDKYSSNEDRPKDTLTEDLKRFKEMNDEEFKKAWSEFLKGMQGHIDLEISLKGFVRDFYSKKGVKLKDMTEDELKSELLESLKGKRYLLVMDDIWNTEVWNKVSSTFLDNSNGSRILITSRIKEVAVHASSLNNSIPSIPPYELALLKEDESWGLFSKKVFPGATCPLELVTLGRLLVKSCHGLPLAIVVLGGLLANKEKTHRTWSKYIGNVNSYLNEDRSSCMDILALSYNHLPRHLKPCFLYFGIYPEDFGIPVRQIIRLWIAEGFIRQIGNRIMEDIAEDYLEELIDRSLIQVATKRLDGGVKTCRIHDILRDLCISESAEEKFLEVRSDVNHSLMSKSRRISIHCANQPYIFSNSFEPSNNRSLIVFKGVARDQSTPDKSYLKWLCETNKLVRVVEHRNMGTCCDIPKNIENLSLLRYLSIRADKVCEIPKPICNLWNLETLDLRNSTSVLSCLPEGIWELKKLRHLYLDGPTLISPPRAGKEVALPNLQVFTGIALNEKNENLFAKARFPNVRKLGVKSSRCKESGLFTSLHPLRHLQILKIKNIGYNGKFSSPISFELTLTKITLQGWRVVFSATVTLLGSLTNLRILKVVGCDRFVLHCNESSFCQLEVFKMAKVTDIVWTMEKGAMPRLQRLVIERCNCKMIPLDKQWCLSTLRDVEVLHPNPELANMLRQLQMRDGCKLQVYPPLSPFPTTN